MAVVPATTSMVLSVPLRKEGPLSVEYWIGGAPRNTLGFGASAGRAGGERVRRVRLVSGEGEIGGRRVKNKRKKVRVRRVRLGSGKENIKRGNESEESGRGGRD